MADAVVTTQSPAPPHFSTFRGRVGADISVDPGTPLAPSGSDVIFAQANAAPTANVSGLASSAGEAPGNVNIQYAGPLTLTTEQWDERVTGQSGGLTEGDVYYLSATNAGKLTTTPPTGPNYQTPIGFAVNSTTMMIQLGVAVPQS